MDEYSILTWLMITPGVVITAISVFVDDLELFITGSFVTLIGWCLGILFYGMYIGMRRLKNANKKSRR